MQLVVGAGGAVPGTFCKGDAAPRLIGLGTRLLYVSYNAWLAEASGAWLCSLRDAQSR